MGEAHSAAVDAQTKQHAEAMREKEEERASMEAEHMKVVKQQDDLPVAVEEVRTRTWGRIAYE